MPRRGANGRRRGSGMGRPRSTTDGRRARRRAWGSVRARSEPGSWSSWPDGPTRPAGGGVAGRTTLPASGGASPVAQSATPRQVIPRSGWLRDGWATPSMLQPRGTRWGREAGSPGAWSWLRSGRSRPGTATRWGWRGTWWRSARTRMPRCSLGVWPRRATGRAWRWTRTTATPASRHWRPLVSRTRSAGRGWASPLRTARSA